MSQTTFPLAAPIATLEINDGHLPVRMVAGRFRADLPRIGSGPVNPRRLRAGLVMATLLALVVPVVNVTRRRITA